MKKILYFTLIISILSSCKSAIEDLNIDTPQRYTVSCFLSPQDSVSLFLGLSYPINKTIDIEENRNKIRKAIVYITNEKGEKFTLKYNEINRTFFDVSHLLKIENSKKYNLEITTSENNIIRSSCIVPKKVPDFKVKVDSVNGLFYLKYTWQDVLNEENFYRYVGVKKNLIFLQEHEIIWTDGSQIETQIASDEKQDGKEISSNRSDTQKNETGGFTSTSFGTYVDATLLNIDKNYFLFQQSFEKTKRGNNFEPTPTFSNIEGGLGIFSSCDILRKTVRIR